MVRLRDARYFSEEEFYHRGQRIMWKILFLLPLIVRDSIKEGSAGEMSSPVGVVFSQSSETRCGAFHGRDSVKVFILKYEVQNKITWVC